MANLTKADLGKRSNDETFLDKFFHKPGHMNIFSVKRKNGKPKEGIFVPSALVFMVDGDEIVSFEPDQKSDYDEALARMQENMSLGGTKNKILLTGKFKNDQTIATVSLADLQKTSEFGGQGGGNRGNKFEDEFLKSLDCEIECLCEHTKYEDQAKKLVELIDKEHKIKGGITKAIKEGGANKKRPLSYSGGLYVAAGGSKTKDIGSTITDITATFGGEKEVYLSLKFGDTLTFINSGVGKVFLQKDYETQFKSYNNSIGNAIFDMFAIDKIEYANVFNKYGKGYKGKKVDVSRDAIKSAIEDLLQYAIGYGYYMVHAKGSTVDCYEMSKAYMKKAAKINGKIMLHYGGATGKGKRLDMHLESSVYKFMFNLRNKQGGKYPSHIMCDYKKK